MKAIQENFSKVATNYGSRDLAKISRDKKAQGKLSDKNKQALEGYITTEEFHKKFNKEMVPKLNTITNATEFKEYLYELEGLEDFNIFSIKLVLQSVDSANPPTVKNFRAIALST